MTAAGGSRVALVQGASRGLGLALAQALLERGDCETVVATARRPDQSPELAALGERHGDRLVCARLDVCDEGSIAAAAALVRRRWPRLQLLVNAAGILHGEGLRPEKRLEDVDAAQLRRLFQVNAFGPLLVAKHFWRCLRHERRAVLASVSARVGSIGDDRLGGWYGYRASKAAQNMSTRNVAIELARRAPNAICVALHPGTVATELSRPFRRSVSPERLFPPEHAAAQLLDVIAALRPGDSGGFFDWQGEPIPW